MRLRAELQSKVDNARLETAIASLAEPATAKRVGILAVKHQITLLLVKVVVKHEDGVLQVVFRIERFYPDKLLGKPWNASTVADVTLAELPQELSATGVQQHREILLERDDVVAFKLSLGHLKRLQDLGPSLFQSSTSKNFLPAQTTAATNPNVKRKPVTTASPPEHAHAFSCPIYT